MEEPVAAEVEEPVAAEVEEPVAAEVEEPVAAEVEEPAAAEEPVAEVQEPLAAEVQEPLAIEEPVTEVEEQVTNAIPKLIFIVPYRDRVEQQRFFSFQMQKVLEDYKPSEYKIIYSHQTDERAFNRGAMKNIGFLYGKSLYPNDYQNITFVFNDVDTMPYNKGFINYETTHGNVKHFYGYTYTLGGIVSITGADYEKTNGFPNYWAWGYEDNAFQNRVASAGLLIDRSQFYPILDKNILQLKDGITRIVNRGEFDRYVDELRFQNNSDGMNTLTNIVYQYVESTGFLNIGNFQTPIPEKPELNKVHDMREGTIPFQQNPQQRRGRPRMGMIF